MTRRGACAVEIRPPRPGDVAALARLCRAHARYERVDLPANGQEARLERALFEPPPRLYCRIVESRAGLVGYAACSREFSTWLAKEYFHVDALYLEPSHRGRGIGRSLMAELAAVARELELSHLEWQTPDWNAPAIRFYENLGARGAAKVRFTWHPSRGTMAT